MCLTDLGQTFPFFFFFFLLSFLFRVAHKLLSQRVSGLEFNYGMALSSIKLLLCTHTWPAYKAR